MDDPKSRCRNRVQSCGREREAKVREDGGLTVNFQLPCTRYEHSHLEREAPEQGNRPRAAFYDFGLIRACSFWQASKVAREILIEVRAP